MDEGGYKSNRKSSVRITLMHILRFHIWAIWGPCGPWEQLNSCPFS